MTSKQPRKRLEAKLFPFQARKNLFEMAKKHGKRKFTLIAVWTYMFTRSGKGNIFKLAESIILWDLGMTHEPLWQTQKILMAEGFLSKTKRRVKEVTEWTVLTGGKSADKSLQADNPPAAYPTVDKSASGLSANTVGIHEQDANASTSKTSLPSERTSTDGRCACLPVSSTSPSATSAVESQKHNQFEDCAAEAEQNQHQIAEQLLDQESDLVRDVAEQILYDLTLALRLGVPYLTSADVPHAISMAKHLISYSRTPDWLRDMVSWMKRHSFWKKRLHAGRRSVGQLAKFMATGEIAAQFDQHLVIEIGSDALTEGKSAYVNVWYREEAMSAAASADADYQAKGFDVEEAE